MSGPDGKAAPVADAKGSHGTASPLPRNPGAEPDVTVALSDAEDPALFRVLFRALEAFNSAAAGPHGFRPLNLSVTRPGEAEPVGGLSGFTFYGWLFVRLFYLPDDLRGAGLGRDLLARAEAEARARGCVGAYLDTFSFQARPFSERQGYREFGVLDDNPPGHTRHFMMKRFS
jgi:GNAT superfamily N-acetyltransferase